MASSKQLVNLLQVVARTNTPLIPQQKSEKFIFVDGGDRTHHPKTHGLSTTLFAKVLVGC